MTLAEVLTAVSGSPTTTSGEAAWWTTYCAMVETAEAASRGTLSAPRGALAVVATPERRRALVAELRELPGVVCDPVTGVLTRDRFWLVVLTDGLELERARGRRVGIVWLDPDVSEDARSVARQVLA